MYSSKIATTNYDRGPSGSLKFRPMKRTKGFVSYGDRKMCEDCKHMQWVGNGSRKQQSTYCTKIEPNFMVYLEDVCDEFEPK